MDRQGQRRDSRRWVNSGWLTNRPVTSRFRGYEWMAIFYDRSNANANCGIYAVPWTPDSFVSVRASTWLTISEQPCFNGGAADVHRLRRPTSRHAKVHAHLTSQGN
jgi:hypothetical protein